MAGSWDHIVTKSGKFQGTRLIDDLGDAYEALEECYGMIQWLADQAEARPGPGILSRDEWIKEAEQHYKEGLDLGGLAKKRFSGE